MTILESGSKIEESNETNNSFGKYFTWYDVSEYKPDLAVEIVSPTNSNIKGSKDSSDTREFIFKISNIGGKATPEDGFIMSVYIDNKKIANMRIPQMNGMFEQSGRFNLGINGYLPFTLNLVADDLDDVDETNGNNNEDEIEYTPAYCRHFSEVIMAEYIPFPGRNIKPQLVPTALEKPFSQEIFETYLGKWNGITEKCSIDRNVSVDRNILDDTDIFIYDYEDPYVAANEETCGEIKPDGDYYVRLGLNTNALAYAIAESIGCTIQHEFGHAFGMGHPERNGEHCGYVSIMTTYNGNESLKSDVIMPHDKYALTKQYDELSTSMQTIEEISEIREVVAYGDMPWIVNSEKSLDEASEYIVKGYFVGDRENVETDYRGYTLGDFVITKVYKGNGVEAGDTIKIREPYYTHFVENDLKTICRNEDYSDSLNGEEYIFFLKEVNNIYGLPYSTLSRYPISDEIQITFPHSDDINFTEENFRHLRDEVLRKYN